MHVAASSGFHRRPRPRAVAWILPELRRRFHRWQANGFLDALSAVHRAHPVPVASAASKRYSPHEAVARDAPVSLRAAARCSPGLCPSRALLRSSLRSFIDPADHSVHRGASTANVGEGYSPPLGETATTSRSRRPRRRVSIRVANANRHVPPLGDNPASHDLGACGCPPAPGPRRFEGLDQRPICER
jgi:hypothetical protein